MMCGTCGAASRRLRAMEFVDSQVPQCEGPGAPGAFVRRYTLEEINGGRWHEDH